MKHITLLGDSIRLGYQDTVKTLLQDQAEIWSPDDNCMHSVNHLFNLAWYVDRPADLIHFNFGLWDCRRLGRDRSENAVPVEIFTRNLDFILERVKASTSARLIWATITPIVQDRYNARFNRPFDPCRVASDVNLYNAAAAPILQKHQIHVNDLNTLVNQRGTELMICDDGVHYTSSAYVDLGRQVADKITQLF